MTIAPETLRTIADNATMGPGALNWVNAVQLALTASANCIEQQAARIEQLEGRSRAALVLADREWSEVQTAPYDDCECVVCETLRNPPPPSDGLKALVRKHRESQGDITGGQPG
jgi:hypothetical protein